MICGSGRATRRAIRRGFTLLELLLTISVIAVIALVVLPSSAADDTLRLKAAGDILASDLELAQTMTVSYPDDPVVVRFNDAGDGYWLAYADDPETPMSRTDNGEAYSVTFGIGRTASAAGVTLIVGDMTDRTIAFNEQGGLENFSQTPKVELRASSGGTNLLTVSPATGTATQTLGGRSRRRSCRARSAAPR